MNNPGNFTAVLVNDTVVIIKADPDEAEVYSIQDWEHVYFNKR